MKLILCAALLFSVSAYSQTAIPENWQLSARQARAMIQYFGDCTGDCFTSKATPDSTKENLIRAAYPNAKSFSWMNARYRSDDVERYASRNATALKTGGTQVAGYTTRILRVIDEDDTVRYFDISLICPPPSICDTERSDDH